MSLQWRPSVVATRIFDLVTAYKNVNFPEGDVFYGDQDKIARSPTVCIEAGDTSRPLEGVPNMVLNTHTCYILIYHSRVQDVQTTKLESEQFAEGIALMLDQNLQLKDSQGNDPIVAQGWVIEISPGYSFKSTTLFKATRLTWQGIAKTRLGVE